MKINKKRPESGTFLKSRYSISYQIFFSDVVDSEHLCGIGELENLVSGHLDPRRELSQGFVGPKKAPQPLNYLIII